MDIASKMNDYIMNILNSLDDDTPIRDFRDLWISKREEFDDILNVGEPKEEPKEPKEEPKEEPKGEPKGEPSEYVKFCRENRQQVKDNNPDMKGVDIMRELARMWKIKKPTKSKKVKESDSDDGERKLEQVEDKPTMTKTTVSKTTVNKTIASKPRVSKKPKEDDKEDDDNTDYIRFCKENRAKIKEKYPDMNPLEVTRELVKEWRKLQNITLDEIRNIIGQAME
jgi:hypothetical protein